MQYNKGYCVSKSEHLCNIIRDIVQVNRAFKEVEVLCIKNTLIML